VPQTLSPFTFTHRAVRQVNRRLVTPRGADDSVESASSSKWAQKRHCDTGSSQMCVRLCYPIVQYAQHRFVCLISDVIHVGICEMAVFLVMVENRSIVSV
jgi:hypothetical protein